MKQLELIFEKFLWNSRFVVVLAVIASLVTSFSMFYIASVDVYYMIAHLGDYMSPSLANVARSELRASTITHVVEVVDGYLLATVMLIFALGLYELFISNIDEAIGSETSSSVLMIHSLDDLKGRLAKVIMMILIVKFFEHAIKMDFHSPLDLVYLAAGIALLGLALYLTHAVDPVPSKKDEH